jgi:asparagine synthase (glutamine-hydrolysing)
VTAIASNYLQKQGGQLNTFSFDFRDNDIYFQSNTFQPERDLPYVQKMLTRYPTHHTYLECDEYQLFQALFTAVDAKDLPGMADVDASLLYFCSQVKQHNKVALTGECADEIFGGYPWFYREELLSKDGFPWSSDMTGRTAFLSEEVIKDLDLAEYSYARYQESKALAPLLYGETGEDKSRRIIGYLNIKWFMQTLLDRMDRTSMYSGLEARVPFADHRIMEYVYNVPWHMKYQNGVEKNLLRDACADLLPPELVHRKKSPYPKTYHPGYEKLLIQSFREILSDSNAPILPLLDRGKVQQFLDAPAEYGKPWFGQLMAGPQLMAYFIQMNYWMKKYHLSI